MSSWQGYIRYQEELSQLSQHTHSGQAPHTCTSSLEEQIHHTGPKLKIKGRSFKMTNHKSDEDIKNAQHKKTRTNLNALGTTII